jgi:molybdopterin-guanine dinucleotide biosynthesis protein A
MDRIEAFILIGGRSSRLGTDKAFVRLGGVTLAERAVANVQTGLSPQRITMVAGNSAQFAIDAISSDVPFVFDLHEGRGPLGAIHAALAYAQTPWIFVLACDYPFISPELIKILREKISDEFGAVVPQQRDGRLQPLCAFYNVIRSLPLVEEILLTKRASPPMHEIVGNLNPLVIPFDIFPAELVRLDPFTNINDAGDLKAAKTMERDLLEGQTDEP